jgi:hypothetical protein
MSTYFSTLYLSQCSQGCAHRVFISEYLVWEAKLKNVAVEVWQWRYRGHGVSVNIAIGEVRHLNCEVGHVRPRQHRRRDSTHSILDVVTVLVLDVDFEGRSLTSGTWVSETFADDIDWDARIKIPSICEHIRYSYNSLWA